MQKILIVEDDLSLSNNMKDELLESGFLVDVVFDGFVAEKFLKKETYDCVILDVNLPHKNGYEICKDFRKTNTTTPVLFLTAFSEIEDKLQGFDSGADDYLTKPFYSKELLARIKVLLKRKDNSVLDSSHRVIVKDLTLDLDKKEVLRGDKIIELTPREFQILLTLAQAKGAVVSKQDLIKLIWGNAFETNTNTIEVFINLLRNKIDKAFDEKLIKTKVGFGYFLDVKN